jgi:tetratricopeptide (TPR) repeat protein
MISNFSKTTQYFNLAVVLSFCLISACSGLSGKQKPAPIYNSKKQAGTQSYNPVIQTTPYAVPEQPVEMVPFKEQARPKPTKKPPTAAVIALLNDADKHYNAGNFQSAVAAIERALRIEPRNASLVYRLAAIKLKQGEPGMAEDLAKKSALLAAGEPSIKKRSWLLIAEARRMQGDNFGAQEAQRYAEKF